MLFTIAAAGVARALRRHPLARGDGAGRRLARRGGCGIPHLYDMHSSLPQQLSNFKYSESGALRRVFDWAEGQMVHELAGR